jgi:transketolase
MPSHDLVTARRIRQIILRESKQANVGHIGSCLCVADILTVLYGSVLRIASPADRDRDRFILSKGHAGLALFAVLSLRGFFPESLLQDFCGEDTRLGVHPDAALTGVDFSTGSLGHGLSFAAGAALAARMQNSGRRVFCLISDAELNEGSTWEAIMFAAHHRLGNLTAIVDWNGQQAFGATRDVLDLSNLAERWRAFGWRVSDVDGHSHGDLAAALSETETGLPHVVLARTVFGRGVSYMEQGVPITQSHLAVQPITWHYLPMSDEEYGIALAEVEAAS